MAHVHRARAKQRPHCHFDGTRVRRWDDAHAVVRGESKECVGLLTGGFELCLARLRTVRTPKRGIAKSLKAPARALGTRARAESGPGWSELRWHRNAHAERALGSEVCLETSAARVRARGGHAQALHSEGSANQHPFFFEAFRREEPRNPICRNPKLKVQVV